MNGESDTKGRTWDRVRGVSVKIRCPRDSGVGICARLCVYAFGVVWNVIHDMWGCHMFIVIDPG